MSSKSLLYRVLKIRPEESQPVFILLGIGLCIGFFLPTFSIASTSLFLYSYSETEDLPIALVASGFFSIIFTWLYSRLQGRISFQYLAIFSLSIILVLVSFIEFGAKWINEKNLLYYLGFTLILPFTYISTLIFWGAFNRLFNLQQTKRILGSIDIGMEVASVLSFVSIPILLNLGIEIESLFSISLASIACYLILYFILSNRFLKTKNLESEETKKLSFKDFYKSRYIMWMSLFIIITTVASRFVDYSFLNVATEQFNSKDLPYFLSYFEGAIVIFSFLFNVLLTERIIEQYGLQVTMLINPILILIFTVAATVIGLFLGYTPIQNQSVYVFFIMVAMSKLFISSMKNAIDEPAFRYYYIPLNQSIKIDAQTKIEGIVMGVASLLAGGVILIINQSKLFTLLSITAFTIPIILFWYWIVIRIQKGYRNELQKSLSQDKIQNLQKNDGTKQNVLQQNQGNVSKLLYQLKIMEKVDPVLFENYIIEMTDSKQQKIKDYAVKKVKDLDIQFNKTSISKELAQQAVNHAQDNELISVSANKLSLLSKSVRQSDRIFAAKLLRKLIDDNNIFSLLELLRDQDPIVREEALITARKVKRAETWNILIEMLASSLHANHAASILKEAGEKVLDILDNAFYKSGQSDLVALKIVQIIGRIGGNKSIAMMWQKINYPDKQIVNTILRILKRLSHAKDIDSLVVIKNFINIEMSKMLWNLAAIDELPTTTEYHFLREALSEETMDNYEKIMLLLSLMYDKPSVALVKKNIDSQTSDNIAYAIELLNLFVVDTDIKDKLPPLLDGSPIEDKMEKLHSHFYREKHSTKEIINSILNRDPNSSNRWTKMCVLYLITCLEDYKVNANLIAQMFNPDKVIQETAAWAIYNKDKKIYNNVVARIPPKDKKFLDSSIKNNQVKEGLGDGFFLGIEMIMFIKQLSFFEDVKGNSLCDIADKIEPLTIDAGERTYLNLPETTTPILIMAEGEVILRNVNHKKIVRLQKGETYGDIFQEESAEEIAEIEANKYAVVFLIRSSDFYSILATHQELIPKIINNQLKRVHR